MNGRIAVIFSLLAAWALPVAAEEMLLKVSVDAGKHARQNTPVRVVVYVPLRFVNASATLTGAGQPIEGQLLELPLLEKSPRSQQGLVARELAFVLPEAAAGKSLELTAALSTDPAKKSAKSFAWTDKSGEYAELAFSGRPVMRYMYAPLDESSKDARAATMKVYHHVYDPTGKRLVTKGPGGLFPHHRGLFYGFNKISYGDGKTADTWHCNNGEFQSHERFVRQEAGPVIGRHILRIAWHGKDTQVFAEEQREMTAWNVAGAVVIDFASRLESKAGTVKLDGDPQHAGFQFRASQDVPDKTAKLTYYVRPDGKGEPGKFRNWPGDKGHVNLPWHALSFVLDEQRDTCCYLDRLENPKESRFSERDYGRFGSYFVAEVTPAKPLELAYRVWLTPGELDVAGVQRLADDFVEPPVAK